MDDTRVFVDLVGALEQFEGWVVDVPGHFDRDRAMKRIKDGTEALRQLVLSGSDSDDAEGQLRISNAEWRGPMRDLLGRGQADIDSLQN